MGRAERESEEEELDQPGVSTHTYRITIDAISFERHEDVASFLEDWAFPASFAFLALRFLTISLHLGRRRNV
jgi:hypothetical protein